VVKVTSNKLNLFGYYKGNTMDGASGMAKTIQNDQKTEGKTTRQWPRKREEIKAVD
jgi:hypothetical protein